MAGEVREIWYVYMIRTERGELYTGIAKNICRRMRQHTEKKQGAKFTRSRRIVAVASLWSCEEKGQALSLEYALKHLTKKQKERLVACPRLLSTLLPAMEKEDYIHHPMADLSLFLGQITLCDLP